MTRFGVVPSISRWFLSCLTVTSLSAAAAFRPAQKHLFRSSSLLMSSYETSKLESPSAERNKEPIWKVLEGNVLPLLPKEDICILEVAAGAGVHSHYFCQQLAALANKSDTPYGNVSWFPTDPDLSSRKSIEAYRQELSQPILQSPGSLTLNTDGIIEQDLPLPPMDLIICINMIHISPWQATVGLMKAAEKLLKPGGVLYCYGPFKEKGSAVESNLNFDLWLKARDPSYGVRNLEDVVEEARKHGLILVDRIEMPANNLSTIYQKRR